MSNRSITKEAKFTATSWKVGCSAMVHEIIREIFGLQIGESRIREAEFTTDSTIYWMI